MKIVLDTNVFISAVFFGGVPGQILDMWRDGNLEIVLSKAILDEYQDVVGRLQKRYPGVDPDPIVSLVVKHGTFVQPTPMHELICTDPDDDIFLATALGGSVKTVVSGDKHLLSVSEYQDIKILTPAQFIEKFGSEPDD